MTILASDIFQRVTRICLDETNVRWPLSELRLWLNDAMREISVLKPTASSTSIVHTLVNGTYQKLSNEYMSVIRVTRNLKSNATNPRQGGRAVRVVDRLVMDSQLPDWHDTTKTPASSVVKNVIFDVSNPTAFYVYPPNNGTGFVEVTVSKVPTPVPVPTSPADPEDIANYNVALDILDIYANAIVDYCLYRAYSKDAAFAGNAQRAAAHYTAMANALGVSIQNDMSINNMNIKPTVQDENAA